MSSKKLFSKLLAKSLLIPAVVSCFSCSFVFSMEEENNPSLSKAFYGMEGDSAMNGVQDQVLNNIRVATQAVVDNIIVDIKHNIFIVISNSGNMGGVIIKGKSEYIRKLINNYVPNIDEKFKSRVAVKLIKSKFKNYELSLARLNQPDALDLLKEFALEYFNSETETMLTELAV